MLNKMNYRETEGIFRKEGRTTRIAEAEVCERLSLILINIIVADQSCFLQKCLISGDIPEDLSAIEICQLLKRFYKYIQSGIFAGKEETLLNFAFSDNVASNDVHGLPELLNRLPKTHYGALVYLLLNFNEVRCFFPPKFKPKNFCKIPNLFFFR